MIAALHKAAHVVGNMPLNERQVNMARIKLGDLEYLDASIEDRCSIWAYKIWEKIRADIKEARPTVRRKPPVQQLKTDKPLCGLYRKCIESVPKYCGGKGSGNVSQLGCYKYPAARSVV